MSCPKRELGKTGEKLSIIGLGGIVVRDATPEEARQRVRFAIDGGVNYFDVSPTYGDAEIKLGPALAPYRDRVFLACKTVKRDAEGAAAQLARSLERLQTDHLDLYQFHGLDSMQDLETVLGPGGAMEVFLKARDDGRIRFIGFSCHTEATALAVMDRFDFDTILWPVNCTCYLNGDFGPRAVAEANSRNMGVLAIKSMARSPWPDDNVAARPNPKCWYMPWQNDDERELALRFTLSENITAAVPPGDEGLFAKAVEFAQGFTPASDADRREIERMVKGITPIFKNDGR